MSVNKFRPHVLVLPEDDANRQMANGFLLSPALDLRSIQVLPPSGGWGKVVEEFGRAYVREMGKYPGRYMVLLVDFDEQADRLDAVRQHIPEHLRDRVFVLGAWSEPEKLRSALSADLERIGTILADECAERASKTWDSELLAHNAGELARMTKTLKPILFS